MKPLHEYMRITVHLNVKTGAWFFSTDHCQHFGGEGGWVPITYAFKTPSEVRDMHGWKMEVENPDQEFVPDWWWEL